MLIVVRIDPSTYERIKDLVDNGNYLSVETFAEVAIRNQLVLETSEGGLTLPQMAPETTTDAPVEMAMMESLAEKNLLAQPHVDKVQTVSPPASDEDRRNKPLWGQISRYAPSKVVLRILSNMVAERGKPWIELKELYDLISHLAPMIKNIVAKIDKQIERVRGEELHVGFPTKEPTSLQRFLIQYVGRLRGVDSRVEGLPGEIKFVNLVQHEDAVVIGITENGLKFASMRSPLVDGLILNREKVEEAFSPEEKDFLMRHLAEVRPGEYEFLTQVLDDIKGGADSPESLQALVGQFFEERRSQMTVTDTVLKTMRAGATSKLIELRLIRVRKRGTRTRYLIQADLPTSVARIAK